MSRKHRVLYHGFAASWLRLTVLTLTTSAMAQHFVQQNLVSDIAAPPGGAPQILDPDLVNPWGVAYSTTGPFWVANQGTGTATVYSVDGTTGAISKSPLRITIPGSLAGQPNGPTGLVSNPNSYLFPVTYSDTSYGISLFIFSALNGTISGWNPNVPRPVPSTTAVTMVTAGPANVYTGLAFGIETTTPILYAANPARALVQVIYPNWGLFRVGGSFFDPNLPLGDVPFNVVNIGGNLFVTYAGPVGVVNIFDTDGNFIKRFATGGTLQNPWGVAVAPAQFGRFKNVILIGNFNHSLSFPNGSGWISAFDADTGDFRGLLEDEGKPIAIDGLHSLVFGNGGNGGIPNVLYFSAGIGSAPGVNLETHGLFASLAWQLPRH